MNVVDLLIVATAALFAVSGYRNGALLGAFSLFGFFVGALIGARLASPIGSALAHGQVQVPIAIVTVLFCAMVGQIASLWAGGHVRTRLISPNARSIDHAAGAVFGVLSVLLVSWMIAIPLARSPFPGVASAISHSTIVRQVQDAMPSSVSQLYANLERYIDRSGFPPVLGPLPPTDHVEVRDPQLTPQLQAAASKAHRSVFKIRAEAPSCNRGMEGTGFVYSPQHVMTNAHVVAGADRIRVETPDGDLTAHVVLFDPNVDIAVLYVDGLEAPALRFTTGPSHTNDPGAVLGFPEDGPYTVGAAVVRERQSIVGRNIYGGSVVERDIYSIKATVRSGNSGGPMISPAAAVIGVVFATATDSRDTGYVLAESQVAADAANGRAAMQPVATGRCSA